MYVSNMSRKIDIEFQNLSEILNANLSKYVIGSKSRNKIKIKDSIMNIKMLKSFLIEKKFNILLNILLEEELVVKDYNIFLKKKGRSRIF